MVTLRKRPTAGDDAAASKTPPPPPTTTTTPARAPPRRPAATTFLREAFWPTNTPVTPDYAPFVYWNALQGLSSYVRGVLSSAAVFASLGVGDNASTPLAAATLTSVRDCTGTAGGILFAYLQGSSFDAAAKQWRLFADILNDVAMALDLASPLLVARLGPAGFLLVASAAALARALVGVAAGATGAALAYHFSQGGKGAAELSAKADSRERAASIAGTVLGIGLARLVARASSGGGGGPGLSWALFAALTWLHIWANARAMRCLVLDTLTPARLELLLLPGGGAAAPLPTPEQAAALETLLPPPFERAARRARAMLLFLLVVSSRRPAVSARVRFGAPLGELLEVERRRQRAGGATTAAATPASVLAALRRRSALPDSYLVVLSRRRWGEDEVLVAVRRGCDPEARLRAFAHGLRLASGDREGEGEEREVEERAARWAVEEFERWRAEAAARGWRVDGASALLPRVADSEGEW
jgi:hypothetical protein